MRKYIYTILCFLVIFDIQAQHLEIDYIQIAKSPEGQEFTSFQKLKDDGKSSLYLEKDTSFSSSNNVIKLKRNKPTGIYIDKTKDILILYAPIFNKDYYVMEDSLFDLIKWTIIDTVKKTILNYECKLATANFRGREYKVFFTESLPFFTGPWKLCGLPGAILEAITVDGLFQFKAIQVYLKRNQDNIINPYSTVNEPFIGFLEHKKLFLKKLKDAQQKAQSQEKDDDVEYTFKDNSIEILK